MEKLSHRCDIKDTKSDAAGLIAQSICGFEYREHVFDEHFLSLFLCRITVGHHSCAEDRKMEIKVTTDKQIVISVNAIDILCWKMVSLDSLSQPHVSEH